MNPFDMMIVVVLVYCIVRGIFRGLIREVASIVGLVAGFYVAYSYHSALGPLFAKWITTPAYLHITCFIILFCSVFLMIVLAGMLVRFFIRLVLLGVVDRIFGGVFGVLKAVLIVSFAYILLVTFLPAGGSALVRESTLAPQINRISSGMIRLAPADVRTSWQQKLSDLKQKWDNPS